MTENPAPQANPAAGSKPTPSRDETDPVCPECGNGICSEGMPACRDCMEALEGGGRPMTYASVCDGIGAVHCAWQPLGWRCAWTSEIDRFPIEVVDLRWGFRNLGDMTAITREMIDEHGPIDLLVGGTPCQSFSVAGLRGGLDDARGNLALRFMQLCAAARPRWVVWENVPGVLSVDGGRAFGSILHALEELGYGWAYRTLDAQWFGVAQRRRRVFVVGHLGDWRRAAAVLFERESVRGDPPTREAARQGPAPDAGRGSSGASWWDGGQLSQTLDAVPSKGQTMPEKNRFPAVLEPMGFRPTGGSQSIDAVEGLSPSLKCGSRKGGEPTGVMCPMQQPFAKAKRAQSASDDETWKPGEVSPTLNHFDVGDTRATTVVAYDIHGVPAAKGASPTDCHTPLRSRTPGQSEASTTTVVAFTQNQRDEVRDLGDAAGTLNGPGTHQSTYVAEAFSVREDAKAGNFSATPTDVGLAVQAHQPSVQSHHAQIFVAQQQPMAFSCKDSGGDVSEGVAPTLRSMNNQSSNANAGGQLAVAVGTDCYNGAITGEVAATIGTPGSSVNASGPTVMEAIAFKPGQSAAARTLGAQEGVACTLESGGGGNNKQAVVVPQAMEAAGFSHSADGGSNGIAWTPEGSPPIRGGGGGNTMPAVVVPQTMAFKQNQLGEVRTNADSMGTLGTSQNASGRNTPMVQQAMAVRRLTPRECERLQGFADDYTLIPWRKKPAEDCPDGPRYRALGNSMAVPVMRWIGERIAMVDAIEPSADAQNYKQFEGPRDAARQDPQQESPTAGRHDAR